MNVLKINNERLVDLNKTLSIHSRPQLFILKNKDNKKTMWNNETLIIKDVNKDNEWEKVVIGEINVRNDVNNPSIFYIQEVICFNNALDNYEINKIRKILKKYYTF